MSELSDIFKIKWNNFYIQEDCPISYETNIFEIMPKDFLKFAKSDTQTTEIKGKISVVANAKRAIDCQTDYILAYLGYDYKNLKFEKYPEVQTLIDDFNTESNSEKNVTQKLKIIQALEISPVALITRTREVRNKLEHEYSIPQNNEILEAVELAELFINTTTNIVVHKMMTNYYIQNEIASNGKSLPEEYIGVSMKLDYENTYFEVHTVSKTRNEEIIITPEDEKYVYFLKASLTQDFSQLAKPFNYIGKKEYIKYNLL